MRCRHVAVALLLGLLLAAGPTAAANRELVSAEHAGRIVFDLVVLRPLGLVLTTVSLAGAAVAFPVAWPLGGGDHVVDYLVLDPVDRTFRSPLGEF